MPCVLRWNFSCWLAVTDGLESIRHLRSSTMNKSYAATALINIILLILINLCQAGLSLSFARSFGMYFVNWQFNGTVKCQMFFFACFEWMCGIDLAQRLIVILIWDDMSDRPYSTATLETTTFRDSDLETVLITILINIYHWIWTRNNDYILNCECFVDNNVSVTEIRSNSFHWLSSYLVDWLFIRNSAVLNQVKLSAKIQKKPSSDHLWLDCRIVWHNSPLSLVVFVAEYWPWLAVAAWHWLPAAWLLTLTCQLFKCLSSQD